MIDEKLIHSEVKDTLYIHDSFSSMFRGMLNWFQEGFDQRFNYKVMATYDKAVQFFNQKRKSKDGNTSTNILPSITLDPNLDFVNEDRGGKFPWMFPNLDNVHGRYFCNHIDLKEQGVTISVMRTRYSGTCDVTFWLQSIYELMDIRTKLIQYCNGIGRWIRPEFFWTHVILPKELVEFNRHDGKKLDWSTTPMEVIQLATTNTKEYGIPYPLNAMWRLDSLSDGSTKYGADQLTEWKFTATFTWECDIPTFLRLDNYSFYDMRPTFTFGLGPTYAEQPLLNKIESYTSISHEDLIRKYLSHQQLYTVLESKKPLVKMDSTQCQRFPELYKEYNHIVSGIVYTYDELLKLQEADQIPEVFIFLMEKYDESYLELLRKASGCINKYDDSKSEFFTLISSINLPTICNISDKVYNALLKKVGKVITMDPICMLIYNGECKVGRLDPAKWMSKENYDVCNRMVDYFKENKIFQSSKYKLLNFGEAQLVYENKKDEIGPYLENEDEYLLVHPITGKCKDSLKLYVNGEYVPRTKYELYSHKIVFNDGVTFEPGSLITYTIEGYCKLYSVGNAINYHITKEDELNYYSKKQNITIDIPPGFSTDFIRCCSYNGMLDEHTDFELNEDKTKIIFKLEPQRDKVIQVFMNRK